MSGRQPHRRGTAGMYVAEFVLSGVEPLLPVRGTGVILLRFVSDFDAKRNMGSTMQIVRRNRRKVPIGAQSERAAVWLTPGPNRLLDPHTGQPPLTDAVCAKHVAEPDFCSPPIWLYRLCATPSCRSPSSSRHSELTNFSPSWSRDRPCSLPNTRAGPSDHS
jgi:hypothetical protein